ncbi:hypothetical protein LQE92_07615 [Lacrimispora sp. NSJ-141]|uniref:Uncharacterized protein n=1 Tax=Lientehia hominis TaxID=2897778 RepID=A0AAP2RJG4_9FIRM|nr:hypothetical protein [Lientehia hominis]MCD2492498.1 hypothetical protein [Lientehia hominis]
MKTIDLVTLFDMLSGHGVYYFTKPPEYVVVIPEKSKIVRKKWEELDGYLKETQKDILQIRTDDNGRQTIICVDVHYSDRLIRLFLCRRQNTE